MCSSRGVREESVLLAVNRRAIPVLAGAMIATTGVAVVLGGIALYARLGPEQLAALVTDYAWIIFWTGLAEGLALLAGIVVFSAVARRITQPLSDLADAAARITRGGGKVRFDTRGPIREVNRLSESFNELFATRERQTRELQELTRNVLHDLRTPLTHIRHNAELVHDGKADAVSSTEIIAEACNSVLDIVDTNSEISSNYAGIDRTPPEIQNVTEIISMLADMYSSVAEAKGVAFSSSTPAAPISVVGHRDKFQRMIVNLLDNAFKFTPSGGSVALTADMSDGTVVIEVSDTGIGISEEDRPHICERFYRAKDARHEPGNGLGLSLVDAIATFYRGTLTCRSQPGRGSTFTIRLPLSSAGSAVAQP